MAVKDRLPDLRRRAPAGGVPPAPATPAPGAADEELHALLLEVDRLYGWIREVAEQAAIARVLLGDPSLTGSAQLREQLEAALALGQAAGLKACGALRELQNRPAQASTASPAGRAACQHAASARRLCAAALAAHHAVLEALHDQRRAVLSRQLQLAMPESSAEEREALLDEDGDQELAPFAGNVVVETASARAALRAAEERRDELLRVEASLREVHALFGQLAALVAMQQDAVHTVERAAATAGGWVDAGRGRLLRGEVLHRRARQKRYGLIVCIATGFLIVLFVLVLT